MRVVSSLALIGLLAVTACNREAASEPGPAETVSAAAPKTDAVASAPAVLSAVDLRRVCRAGLAAVHGQTFEAVEIEGVTGEVVTAGWRAPVDGGRMRAECRIDNGVIGWRPLDLPDPADSRWMNTATDPVVRYALDGDVVIVTQTSPDGLTEETRLTAPAEGEAA